LGSIIIPVFAQIPAAAIAGRMSPSDRPFLAAAIAERLLQNGLAPEVTVGLIDLLGELGIQVAGSIFIRGLASPPRRIQQAAIRSVLKLGLADLVPMLRQVQSQGDPLLSDEIKVAVDALSKSGKERA
jgi:hypothetical protein